MLLILQSYSWLKLCRQITRFLHSSVASSRCIPLLLERQIFPSTDFLVDLHPYLFAFLFLLGVCCLDCIVTWKQLIRQFPTREGSWLTCHRTMPPDSFMHIAGYSYWPIYIQIVSASACTTSGCATLPASFHDIRLHTAFVEQQDFDVTTSEQCSSYQGLTHLSLQFE